MNNIKEFFITWIILLVLNQLFIYGGCFAPHCILAALPHTGIIAFLLTLFIFANKKDDDEESLFDKEYHGKKLDTKPKKNTQKKQTATDKPKEDDYTRHIGQQFEEKGDLVIYNRLIKGANKKVDLISISSKTKSINVIKCINQTQKPITIQDIKNISNELNNYKLDYLLLNVVSVGIRLRIYKPASEIKNILKESQANHFTVRKTLYISSIGSDVSEALIKIKPDIFRFGDMKIVVRSF